jgi:hypothetical protein
MSYVRTISANENVFEVATNCFFRELALLGHRVMATRFHFVDGDITGIFTINDEAHSHNKKENS